MRPSRAGLTRMRCCLDRFDFRPPPIPDDAPLQAQQLADLRYRPLGAAPTPVPKAESLADCCARYIYIHIYIYIYIYIYMCVCVCV